MSYFWFRRVRNYAFKPDKRPFEELGPRSPPAIPPHAKKNAGNLEQGVRIFESSSATVLTPHHLEYWCLESRKALLACVKKLITETQKRLESEPDSQETKLLKLVEQLE